jgi:hypothetical protein
MQDRVENIVTLEQEDQDKDSQTHNEPENNSFGVLTKSKRQYRLM